MPPAEDDDANEMSSTAGPGPAEGRADGPGEDPLRAGVVIGLAVGVVGVTFGVLARSAGLTVLQACVMSLLVFTGASQFAVVSVVAAGGTALAGFGAAALLAARNTLYGPGVAAALRGAPLGRRLVLAQLVIDESAGLAAAQPDARHARRGFLAAGLGVYLFWNLGTLLGAIAGDVVGDVDRFGLDAAFPACFLALLAPHLRAVPGRAAAILGAAVALVAVPVAPVGVPILLAALAVVPAAALRASRRRVERSVEPGEER